MPENEFEKKVAGELDELKLKPSEQVWLQVEERIRKKKKRRGFFIIFFLMGVALLGWWQWENIFDYRESPVAKEELKTKITNQEQPAPGNTTESKNQVTESTKSKPVPGEAERTPSLNNKQTETHNATFVKNDKQILDGTRKSSKPEKNNQNEMQSKDKIVLIKPAQSIQKPVDANAGAIVKNDQPGLKEKQVNESMINKRDSSVLIIAEEKDNEVKQEELKMEEKKTDSVLVDNTKSNSVARVQKKNNTSSRWIWGLLFSPGISSLNKNAISFNTNKSADALTNANSSTGFPQSNAPASPSESKAGFAFQFGGFAQRQLSSRVSLSLGLQYGYYSDQIHIGHQNDSVFQQYPGNYSTGTARVYSSANATNDFTNHYHFIELPVLLHWQLNRNEKLPFTWDFGLSIHQMFSTNALVYDTAFGGIYINNKNAFHKTQFSLSTGLSWTVLNKNNLQWSIGPVADFFITRLQKNSIDGRDYFSFFGARSAVLFSSKSSRK